MDISHCNDIKQLAQSIITTQESELDQMKLWRQTWYPDVANTPMMYDSASGDTVAMSDTMQAAMQMERTIDVTRGDVEQQFLNAMLPHHKEALNMAKQGLEKSDRSPLKKMARAILKTHRQEMKQMKQWLQSETK